MPLVCTILPCMLLWKRIHAYLIYCLYLMVCLLEYWYAQILDHNNTFACCCGNEFAKENEKEDIWGSNLRNNADFSALTNSSFNQTATFLKQTLVFDK